MLFVGIYCMVRASMIKGISDTDNLQIKWLKKRNNKMETKISKAIKYSSIHFRLLISFAITKIRVNTASDIIWIQTVRFSDIIPAITVLNNSHLL